MDEAEEIFICGTRTTTPRPSEVKKEWPYPWLYSRVFLLFSLASFLLWICYAFFQNPNVIPGLIVLSSFTVPLSTMVLFVEVNAWRDISLYKAIQVFLVGGCSSLVATLLLFDIVGSGGGFDLFGALMIGMIEEVGKAVIVYFFLSRMSRYTILDGLLIGSCVGAEFAAFESAGYALNFLMQGGSDMMMNVIFLRAFLAPGGHVTWAAISGAALAIAAREKVEMNFS